MLKSYIAFDVETTGLNPVQDEIIEIGALKVREGRVAERFIEFIRPSSSISSFVSELTGITDAMVAEARPRKDVIRDFLAFCEDDVLVGHNISFDYSFVKTDAAASGMDFEKKGIDTLKIARDALATAKLYQTLAHYFEPTAPKLFVPARLIFKIKPPQPATPKQISFINNLIYKKKLTVE